MAFQFRFESILELRRRQRDEAGAAVGKANQAIAKIDQQIADIENDRQNIRQRDQRQRVGEISVEGLLSVGRYDMQLQADVRQLQATRIELVVERDRRQTVLMDAEAEVKRYDRLKTKERETERARQLRIEQADADERSNQAYVFARRKNDAGLRNDG
jgi:flagellar protein FliJ